MTVDELNALSDSDASKLFRSCCGSSRWVNGMVAARPFDSAQSVMTTSDEVWDKAETADWHEAFSHHPRIGETTAAAAQTSRAASWSSSEQGAVSASSETVQQKLAAANRQYESRFGHIYIVCATGKSADQMLVTARQRLSNDTETELRVAAGEQGKITRLRLERVLGDKS